MVFSRREYWSGSPCPSPGICIWREEARTAEARLCQQQISQTADEHMKTGTVCFLETNLFFFRLIHLFILAVPSSVLRGRFSSWGKRGLLFIAVASLLCSCGLVAPWHVGSSWIRDRTCVSCIGRRILYHWAHGRTQKQIFIIWKSSLGRNGMHVCMTVKRSMLQPMLWGLDGSVPFLRWFNVLGELLQSL